MEKKRNVLGEKKVGQDKELKKGREEERKERRKERREEGRKRGRKEETTTTNNRMELQAVISGLLLVQPGSMVQIFTTSDYLYQGATRWIHGWRQRNWKKRDGQVVANADLWQALDRLSQEYAIQWVNAKGQELQDLETAGMLAREACDLA